MIGYKYYLYTVIYTQSLLWCEWVRLFESGPCVFDGSTVHFTLIKKAK